MREFVNYTECTFRVICTTFSVIGLVVQVCPTSSVCVVIWVCNNRRKRKAARWVLTTSLIGD